MYCKTFCQDKKMIMLILSQKKEKTSLMHNSFLHVLVKLTFLKYLVVLQAS